MVTHNDNWLGAVTESIASYRRMIDAAVVQLTDEELRQRPTPQSNSVAVILRHLGGNLQSRWTDFLTTDGEKPTRNRDAEFEDWPDDRASLLAYFDTGWQAFVTTITTLTVEDISKSIKIRGEVLSVPTAIVRAVTHVSYHVGQLLLIARLVHSGDWKWLTIAPGSSAEFNSKTWGTPASRGVAGK